MKSDAIQEVLRIIYTSDTSLIISNEDIQKIEEYHKKNLNKPTYLDYLYAAEEVTALIGKLQSGRAEIEKQYTAHKALQGGILSECVYAQTLARIFHLTQCIDLDRTQYNNIPIKCKQALEYIKSAAHTVSAARYIYYGTKTQDYIIQYGNPTAGDAHIIYLNEEIHIEFKQPKAKAGEYDLSVDENGKLSVPETTLVHYGESLQSCIDRFNASTSLFDMMGSNYKFSDADHDALLHIAARYFELQDIDLLVSAVNDQLLVVRPSDLKQYPASQNICNLDGSEIRSTGRNPKAVKLTALLNQALQHPDISANPDGTFTISPVKECHKGVYGDGYGTVKERGGEAVSRYKLQYIFLIKKEKAISWNNTAIVFTKDAVQEVAPTFSVHITIQAKKEDMIALYHSIGIL